MPPALQVLPVLADAFRDGCAEAGLYHGMITQHIVAAIMSGGCADTEEAKAAAEPIAKQAFVAIQSGALTCSTAQELATPHTLWQPLLNEPCTFVRGSRSWVYSQFGSRC